MSSSRNLARGDPGREKSEHRERGTPGRRSRYLVRQRNPLSFRLAYIFRDQLQGERACRDAPPGPFKARTAVAAGVEVCRSFARGFAPASTFSPIGSDWGNGDDSYPSRRCPTGAAAAHRRGRRFMHSNIIRAVAAVLFVCLPGVLTCLRPSGRASRSSPRERDRGLRGERPSLRDRRGGLRRRWNDRPGRRSHDGEHRLREGDRRWKFAAPVAYAWKQAYFNAWAFAAADVNGDGTMDIVWGASAASPSGTPVVNDGEVRYFQGTGTGRSSRTRTLSAVFLTTRGP